MFTLSQVEAEHCSGGLNPSPIFTGLKQAGGLLVGTGYTITQHYPMSLMLMVLGFGAGLFMGCSVHKEDGSVNYAPVVVGTLTGAAFGYSIDYAGF